MISLRLKKGADRRVIRGHDWVFSNELSELPRQKELRGTLVHLQNHQGKFLATAMFNPHTLIAARIISRTPLNRLDSDWFRGRIKEALALRMVLYARPFYRLIFGESDGLPGLVVDRFGDYLVVQITTAGMELHRQEIHGVLDEMLSPKGIVWRADDHFRELEGLPIQPPESSGVVPSNVEIFEGDMPILIDLLGGQKTGWFYDQRDNRLRLRRYAQGKRMLDAFSYAGGWAIHGLCAGAVSATCLDRSEAALQLARQNAIHAGYQVATICGDAFVELKRLLEEGARFDLIVLDPPALIKRKKDFDAGLQAYYQLNRLAAQLLTPSGILISCSCSHHLPEEQLVEIVRHAAVAARKTVRITEIGHQSADHPIHPGMPETRYLKTITAWMSD